MIPQPDINPSYAEIYLEDLSTYSTIGVYDHERQAPLPLSVSVRMTLDDIVKTDRIEDAVNYVDVVHEINEICQKGSFYLVETLAQAILQRLVACYQPAWLQVRLHKVNILKQVKAVGVMVEYRQQATVDNAS